MKKCRKMLLICLLAMSGRAMAQQDAMYTQYMFNQLAINPAYAGSRNVLSVTGLVRSQWVGLEGAPQTATISVDTYFPEKKIGLGLQVFNDQLGITKTNGIFGSYAFRIKGDNAAFSMGIQGGVVNYRADFTQVALNTGSPYDPAFASKVNLILPNFGFGLYYNTDRFFFGASIPHIFNNQLNDPKSAAATQGLVAKQYLHLFVTTGYVFDLGEDYKLKPSVLFKGVRGAPLELDLNANLWIKDVIGLGVQYRTGASVAGMVELQLSDQFRLGYAYDKTTNPLADFNYGSHELMLRYEFGFEKGKINGPRYF